MIVHRIIISILSFIMARYYRTAKAILVAIFEQMEIYGNNSMFGFKHLLYNYYLLYKRLFLLRDNSRVWKFQMFLL